eukprot:s234_g17.t1
MLPWSISARCQHLLLTSSGMSSSTRTAGLVLSDPCASLQSLDMLKAPDDDPPDLPIAPENSTLVALKGVKETLCTVHAEILRKLDDEIRQLRPKMEAHSIELVRPPFDLRPPVERLSGDRRSVTLEEQASPVAHSVERRSLTTQDHPGVPGQLGEDPGATGVVPAPQQRTRTDPKAFLPSLSKKQKGRNYFRQQSLAIQDLASPRQSDRGSEVCKRQSLTSQEEKDMTWRKSLEGNGIFGLD